MVDLIDFEADDVHDDFIDKCEPQNVSDDVMMMILLMMKIKLTTMYRIIMLLLMFVEVSRMYCRTLEWDNSESQPNEVSNYCNDDYNPNSEEVNEFRDSVK